MLKAGIFLDMENLHRNGGWGMRLDAIKELVETQGTIVLRANAYMVVDSHRERLEPEYREKAQKYRDKIRLAGFHIIDKEVKRYLNEDGSETTKANADLDMAVDAILQAENLDYVMIGTGDGDFLRLVRALQNKGKRVDAIAFDNVSNELKREVDYYFPGSIMPKILPSRNSGRERGILEAVNQEKGYGFLTCRTGFKVTDIDTSVFCHISQVLENDAPITNERFSELSRAGAVLEFERSESAKGVQAVNVTVYQTSS
ncbi:MAG TPA: NYN domain-containing protein [Gammaproteobacteria bacterium]|nr:NYN domain-containing protein [Gammaproteobacteria bacterium]